MHGQRLPGAIMLQTLLSAHERSQLDLAKILYDVDVAALGDSGSLYERLPETAWSILLEVYANAHTLRDPIRADRLKSVAGIARPVVAESVALLCTKGYVAQSDYEEGIKQSLLWLMVRGAHMVEARIKLILDLASCHPIHHA
jgi:hypothetical protein